MPVTSPAILFVLPMTSLVLKMNRTPEMFLPSFAYTLSYTNDFRPSKLCEYQIGQYVAEPGISFVRGGILYR